MSVRTHQLAGRFACYVPQNFEQQERRILYIGKATAGDFDKNDDAENAFFGAGPFWHFAKALSEAADPTCVDHANLAWSNIFKQGVTKGNPSGSVADQQWVSAVADLKKENEALKPTIIVLVTAGYYEEIPKEAFSIKDGEGEPDMLTETAAEGEGRYALWSRPALNDIPPIVWMYHPQGKSNAYRAAAVDLIVQTARWGKDRDQR